MAGDPFGIGPYCNRFYYSGEASAAYDPDLMNTAQWVVGPKFTSAEDPDYNVQHVEILARHGERETLKDSYCANWSEYVSNLNAATCEWPDVYVGVSDEKFWKFNGTSDYMIKDVEDAIHGSPSDTNMYSAQLTSRGSAQEFNNGYQVALATTNQRYSTIDQLTVRHDDCPRTKMSAIGWVDGFLTAKGTATTSVVDLHYAKRDDEPLNIDWMPDVQNAIKRWENDADGLSSYANQYWSAQYTKLGPRMGEWSAMDCFMAPYCFLDGAAETPDYASNISSVYKQPDKIPALLRAMEDTTIQKFKWKNNVISEMATYDYASRSIKRARDNWSGSPSMQLSLTHDSTIIPFILAIGDSDMWDTAVNYLYKENDGKNRMIPYASYVTTEFWKKDGKLTDVEAVADTNGKSLNWTTADAAIRVYVNGKNVTQNIKNCTGHDPCPAANYCKTIAEFARRFTLDGDQTEHFYQQLDMKCDGQVYPRNDNSWLIPTPPPTPTTTPPPTPPPTPNTTPTTTATTHASSSSAKYKAAALGSIIASFTILI